MNERERLIKQGLNVLMGMCFFMVGSRLAGVFAGMLSGQPSALGVIMLLLSTWFAWNIYSGNLLFRNIMALVAVIFVFQALFLMIAGFGAGDPLYALRQLFNAAFYAGLIYVLFFYEPVQEYFRYIGASA